MIWNSILIILHSLIPKCKVMLISVYPMSTQDHFKPKNSFISPSSPQIIDINSTHSLLFPNNSNSYQPYNTASHNISSSNTSNSRSSNSNKVNLKFSTNKRPLTRISNINSSICPEIRRILQETATYIISETLHLEVD
jgi:hypothetical protein